MRITAKLIEKDKDIQNGILNGFLPEITKSYNTAFFKIRTSLPQLVNSIIIKSPEYSSLVGGRLKFDLGIPDATSKVIELINIWSSNIMYNVKTPKIAGNKISGSFSASLFQADFSDVLGSSASRVYDNIRGYDLPWLEWLVLSGNMPLVSNYHVSYGPNKRSRTGGAVMRLGNSWSVPSEFAGTIGDNWITRAILSQSKDIQSLVEGAFR